MSRVAWVPARRDLPMGALRTDATYGQAELAHATPRKAKKKTPTLTLPRKRGEGIRAVNNLGSRLTDGFLPFPSVTAADRGRERRATWSLLHSRTAAAG